MKAVYKIGIASTFVALACAVIPVASNAATVTGLPQGIQDCIDTQSQETRGVAMCAYVQGTGWQFWGGQLGGDPITFSDALAYLQNESGDPTLDCGLSYLGTITPELFVFATEPGCELDGNGSVISTNADTGTWSSAPSPEEENPADMTAQYAESLLSFVAAILIQILPFAAAVAAFVIGVRMIRRWLGNRKASQL